MNVLFWERCNFHESFLDRDMSGNIWNRPSGSSMTAMGNSSNIMKSPSPKCYMTFWDLIIYSDTLHWPYISANRDFVTEMYLITVFGVITLFREVSIGHLQRVRLANRGRLLLRTPGPVLFGTCIKILFLFWDHSFLNLLWIRTIWVSNIPRYFCYA